MLIGMNVVGVLAGWLLVGFLVALAIGYFLNWASRLDPPDEETVRPAVRDGVTPVWPRVAVAVACGALALMMAAPALQISGGGDDRRQQIAAVGGLAPAVLPDPAGAASPRPPSRSTPSPPRPRARSRAATRAGSRAPRAAGRTPRSGAASTVRRRSPARAPARRAPSPIAPAPAPSPPVVAATVPAAATATPPAKIQKRGRVSGARSHWRQGHGPALKAHHQRPRAHGHGRRK